MRLRNAVSKRFSEEKGEFRPAAKNKILGGIYRSSEEVDSNGITSRQRWSIVMRRDKGGRRMTNEPRSPSPRFLCSFIFIARHGCRVSIVNPRISLLSWLLPCRTNTPATHIQRSSFQREIWICLVEQGTLFLHLLLRDPMSPRSRIEIEGINYTFSSIFNCAHSFNY